MKVLQFCESLALAQGGPAHSVSQLCNHLNQSGVDVTWVRGGSSQKKADTGLLASEVPCMAWDDFRKIKANSLGKEVLGHSHGIWVLFNHQVAEICRRQGIPWVVSPRGMLEPWALEYRKWKKKVAWHLYQKRDLERATALHATAFQEAENLRKMGFCLPIAVIPNGVERLMQKSIGDEVNAIKEKNCALFLSRIHPKKGIEMLIHSWNQVRPPNWELVIAGNDEDGYRAKMERLVDSFMLREQIRFSGALYGDRKDMAYRKADLFLLPSYSENFGIVVAEALQYGIPVITTRGTPWQELQTERCGWWIDASEEALIVAIREAVALPLSELKSRGARGRALIEKKYHWDGITSRMTVFYQWLLNGQKGGKPDWVI